MQPELAVTTRNDNFTPSAYKTHCQSARSRAVHQFRRRRTENSQYPVYIGVSRPYPRCRKPSICSTDPYFRAREHQIVSSASLRWRAPTDPLTTQTPVNSLSTPISDASLSSASSSVRTTIASARRFIMNNFVGSEWTSQLFFVLRQVASRGNIICRFDDFFYLCRRESVRI